MRKEDRERIQVDVAERVVNRYIAASQNQPEGVLQTMVNDTIYHEMRRLEREKKGKQKKSDLAFYQSIRKELASSSDHQQKHLLSKMARRFVAEIVGNFDQRVYRLSTTVIPTGLSVLLNAMSPQRLLELDRYRSGLAEHITLQGQTQLLRRLLDKGTLVVVPTHSSNLDSIILGYAVYLLGLPPLLYGAGLNLFTNPLISFFMRNLGAYRVDRKKTAGLYRTLLKEYAQVATEYGYHQLFFPGGTRSRSGKVESHLKKGLLGTAVSAYTQNLIAKKDRPNVYIVPCTLSYKLVLEAETLIADYLSEKGKARYIIDDDEFSKPRRVLNFLSNAMSLDDEIVVRFSQPLDVFGNRVNEEGQSLDPVGRVVDTRSYICDRGEPVIDEQRDSEYTNEVSDKIYQSFLSDNVLMTTNVVARAYFERLRAENPDLDLYRLLHTGGQATSFSMEELHQQTERLLKRVNDCDLKPVLSDRLKTGDIQEIVSDALTHFGLYHSKQALKRRGDRVFHQDRNLLLYYANRLDGYGLEAIER